MEEARRWWRRCRRRSMQWWLHRTAKSLPLAPTARVYFLAPAGAQLYAVEASFTPITSLAISHNGERVAAASIGGSVVIIDRVARTLARKLLGSGPPVWA